MIFSRKLKMLIASVAIILVALVSFSLYNAPTKVVKNYINHDYDANNKIINDELVNQFLSFHKVNNLPEPTIELNTVNRTANKAQILANFAIFTYDTNNNLLNIYSGSLLFTLKHTNWTWEIASIDIMKEMGK